MGIVAVAGGTGGVGRALVEAIIARGKHEVKILSRKSNDTLSAEIGAPIIVVDYTSVDGLKDVIEENGFDTVISALSTMPEEGVPPEVTLIQAAQKSKATRRFIPSNWGIPIAGTTAQKLHSTNMKRQAVDELKKTDLEYTVFYAGFFTDFFTGPTIKSYVMPMIFAVDLAHNMAAIPGSGNTPVCFIHTFDLAKYVDLALDMEKWDAEEYVVGDKLTWNEFVKHAEAAKGTKFKVVYDSVEDLENNKITELPSLTKALPFIPVPKEVIFSFSATFGLLCEYGDMDFDENTAFSSKFPEVKPLKIKDALEAAAKAL
ncbi:hypothetical protein G7Z17_g10214 [Cylindrodendrum hubeiense]|uniref:NAD(P)-binding domain-containing protein n=1 Tax=Cylindrodendrum hubeiense TaxID=595255 RepID=A0A9P5H6D2_9HYPO|nr:hypothetical protein G7Z17_g10214 [Cylindrodendrum hubeiense]